MTVVSKHLKVLDKAGLISRSKNAQWCPCRLEAKLLKNVSNWIEGYHTYWEMKLDHFGAYLGELQKSEPNVKNEMKPETRRS